MKKRIDKKITDDTYFKDIPKNEYNKESYDRYKEDLLNLSRIKQDYLEADKKVNFHQQQYANWKALKKRRYEKLLENIKPLF